MDHAGLLLDVECVCVFFVSSVFLTRFVPPPAAVPSAALMASGWRAEGWQRSQRERRSAAAVWQQMCKCGNAPWADVRADRAFLRARSCTKVGALAASDFLCKDNKAGYASGIVLGSNTTLVFHCWQGT